MAVEARDGAVAITGRTPWQITRARLVRDKVTMAALCSTIFFILLAVTAPLMTQLGWLDPYTSNTDLVGGLGSLPIGPLGGVS